LSLYDYYTEQIRRSRFKPLTPTGSGLYCLFITLSAEALEKTVGTQTHRLGRYAPESIFFYAPGNTIHQQFTQAGPQQFLVLTFTRLPSRGSSRMPSWRKRCPKAVVFCFWT
jgi:hypothetical protein